MNIELTGLLTACRAAEASFHVFFTGEAPAPGTFAGRLGAALYAIELDCEHGHSSSKAVRTRITKPLHGLPPDDPAHHGTAGFVTLFEAPPDGTTDSVDALNLLASACTGFPFSRLLDKMLFERLAVLSPHETHSASLESDSDSAFFYRHAVRLAENMDRDSGRLSKNYIHHRKNLAIIGIALCSRAAIEGGLPPENAYQISGYYIGKCDATENAANMLLYRNKAIMEMAGYIRDQRTNPSASNYSERCKDYIRKHYREKIYLQDIADSLGLSPTYLSRRFSKDTGECVQDYINRIRVYHASNLLLYSDRTLSEIAFYVGFPNQSYFGKIFKKFRNMSPKAYQDRYRSTEYDPE